LGQWRPAYSEFGGSWYEFAGSYWKLDPGQVRHGIDWAYQSESPVMYAFHVLIGHHGIFSLSPIFLLTVLGMLSDLVRQPNASRPADEPGPGKIVAGLTCFLTVVVLGFYIGYVSPRSRNYGGWTSTLRWLLWLTPFWLITMLSAADWLAQRRW